MSGEGAPGLTAPGKRRLRALVVGSGYRVRNAFLPALDCLDADVEVVGIHSRQPAHARRAGEPFGVPVIEDLRSLRPGDVDLVLVSVTATNNLAVLRMTAHIAPGAALVMDTPAMAGYADVLRLGLYRRWRVVRVAEDFMNMPQFRLIGRVIHAGVLGDVMRVRQAQMGYRFHALALLRSWLGFALVRSARRRRAVGGGVDIVYRFPAGVTGEVTEPYTRGKGSLEIVGTRGSIAGPMMGAPGGPGGREKGPCCRLERLEDDDGLCGFRIGGLDTQNVIEDTIAIPLLPRLRAMTLEDDSELNLIRVDGLCRVISSLWSPDPVNGGYRLQDAMADFLVSAAARRLPWSAQLPGRNPVDVIHTALRPFRA